MGPQHRRYFQVLVSGFFRGLKYSAGSFIDLDEQGAKEKGNYKRLGAAKRLTLARSSLSWHNRALPVNDSKKLEN